MIALIRLRVWCSWNPRACPQTWPHRIATAARCDGGALVQLLPFSEDTERGLESCSRSHSLSVAGGVWAPAFIAPLSEHLGLPNMTAAVPGCGILRLSLWTFLSCGHHQPQEHDSKHSLRLSKPPIFYWDAPWAAGWILSNMGKFNRWFNLRFCENTLLPPLASGQN